MQAGALCFLPLYVAEEPPVEVKPDQSPVVVKKMEPVLAEHKLQDGSAPAAVPPAPTTSTGSGRRKSKKQKMEAAVTGKTWHLLTALKTWVGLKFLLRKRTPVLSVNIWTSG